MVKSSSAASFTNFNGATLNHLARLGTNGVVDAGFNIGTGFNDTIQSVLTAADGTIVVGGLFTSFNGTSMNRIARLLGPTASPSPRLSVSVTGNSALFSWPLSTAAFQLQASPALGSTAFTNVAAPLTTNGSYVSTTLPVTENQRFFRLKKP
ncbi:MAG TPA: delta-60 repeat domain-containing protein [Candidatus Limnocylindrales bacterium]|nr:delta-60 repeat domain-containing protein [Candidatus Limnocylindrales bacterium]